MYRAVLFDLFGTLIYSPPMTDYRLMVAEIAAILGQPYELFYQHWMSVNDGRLDGSFGSSEGDILAVARMFDIDVSDVQMSACMAVRRSLTRKLLTPKPGSLEMLGELREMDFRLGLVTDSVYDVPAVWPDAELAPFFSAPQFSCVTHIRKPDPRAYLPVVEKLGVQTSQVLFVGDGGSDELNGAIRCGIDALMIDDVDPSNDETLRVGVTGWDGPRVTGIGDVTEYVRNANA